MFMKDYNEMAEAVFARRDEYVREVKRKKKIALSSSLSFCAVCLAVIGAIGIWKTGTVEPDPEVLGTKPAYMTESTDISEELHSLSSNATSEGASTETNQLITRPSASGTSETVNNTKPSQAITKPSEDKPTQATDPAEKPSKPTQKPTIPSQKPENDTPQRPVKPTRPATSVETEPVETPATVPPQTDGIIWEPEGSDRYPSVNPEPTTAVCATDATSAIDGECPPCSPMEPDVPAATEPLCTEPTEAPDIAWPDEVPGVPETQAPTLGTSVSGAVYDQYGNPVGGCEIYAYWRGMVVATAKTDSSGFYYIHTSESIEYLSQHSAPKGFTPSSIRMPLSGPADYSNPDVNFYCTKN